jgi:hypothetical protein
MLPFQVLFFTLRFVIQENMVVKKLLNVVFIVSAILFALLFL